MKRRLDERTSRQVRGLLAILVLNGMVISGAVGCGTSVRTLNASRANDRVHFAESSSSARRGGLAQVDAPRPLPASDRPTQVAMADTNPGRSNTPSENPRASEQPLQTVSAEDPTNAAPAVFPVSDEILTDPATVRITATPASLSKRTAELPKDNLQTIRQIVDRSLAFVGSHPKYSCRVTRQERVGGKIHDAETMLMYFRNEPRAVYYKWLDEHNAGRECIYAAGQNDGKIMTKGGRSDLFMKGRVISVDPNGMLARGKSRYVITESGMDNMVGRLNEVLKLIEQGESWRGELKYQGLVRRQEFPEPLHYILQLIPKGVDDYFPKGGRRHWYFDPESGQIVLLTAEEPDGTFLEYYRFDRLIPLELLSDDDFNPAKVWPKDGSRPTGGPAATATRPADPKR